MKKDLSKELRSLAIGREERRSIRGGIASPPTLYFKCLASGDCFIRIKFCVLACDPLGGICEGTNDLEFCLG